MKIPILAILVLAFGLNACARVNSSVTRFHQLTWTANGKSFVMVPYKVQEESLEYRQYAERVAQKLVNWGMVTGKSVSDADYAIFINYAISKGQTVSGSSPIYGQTGGGSTYHSGRVSSYSGGYSSFGRYSGTSYTTPTYGVIGSIPYRYEVFTRGFGMDIIDLKKSTKKKAHKVFEGKVRSSGRTNSFAEVSNCLIDAMFTKFPGKSGKTIRVKTGLRKCRIK